MLIAVAVIAPDESKIVKFITGQTVHEKRCPGGLTTRQAKLLAIDVNSASWRVSYRHPDVT